MNIQLFRCLRVLVANHFVLVVVAVFLANFMTPSAEAQLTTEEQKLLSSLESTTVGKVVELGERLAEWRQKCVELKKNIESAQNTVDALDESNDPVAYVNAVMEIAKIFEALTTATPALDHYIRYSERIDPLLKSAEAVYQNAQYNAAQIIDIDEAAFREELKEVAYTFAAQKLFEVVDTEIVAIVEGLQNPAQFAKNFADDEIKQWLDTPREVGGVKFKILRTDPAKSLFSPQSDIVIQMQYGPGIVVEAHGLYFRYVDKTPYFEAMLDPDKMQVTTNMASLAEAQLTKVANELLEKIDGPVKVKNFVFTDFGANKAGVKCDIEVNMGELLPMSAKGTVILTTDMKLKWTGALDLSYPLPSPIPIGSTPLGIHTITGGWDPEAKKSSDPKARQLTVGTVISTVAPSTDKIVALNVQLGFDFPVRAVDLNGTVQFGGSNIGDIEGTVDLDKELAEAQFRIPGEGSLIPKTLFSMDGRATFNREGLESVGDCALFGQKVNKSRLFLASNGHGSLSIESGNICGVDIAPRLNVGFKPGMSEIWASMVFEQRVNLGLVNLVDVAIEVEANSKNKDPIYVVIHAWGEKVGFHVPLLAALTPERIAQELAKSMPDLYAAGLTALAQGEAGARDALAKAEDDFKNGVYKALKGPGFDAVRTGNPELDKALGNISTAGKDAGGRLAKESEALGKTLTDLRKNPSGTVSDLVKGKIDQLASIGDDVVDGLNTLLNGGKGKKDSGPSAAEIKQIEQQFRRAKVELALETVKSKLNATTLNRTAKPDMRSSGRDKYASAQQLRISFRNASSELQGTAGAELALLITNSDFTSTINTRGESRLAAESDVKAAFVQLTNLVVDSGKARPHARINVPPLKHSSEFDARQIAHAEIQQLIERYVPNVQIEGPRMHYESELQVANRSHEPITVWVQARFRSVGETGVKWQWAPGAPGSTSTHRFKIAPGKTELLEISSRFDDPNSTVDTEARPLTASRVRIWAESETGERWTTFQDEDLWLIDRNSALDESRGYFAEKARTYTHVVEPKSGERIFSERLVQFRNATKEPLKVSVHYRANEGGQTTWRSIRDFTIPPGASGSPTTAEGMRLRASQIRFTAKGDTFYYGHHERTPLQVVDETDGRRALFRKENWPVRTVIRIANQHSFKVGASMQRNTFTPSTPSALAFLLALFVLNGVCPATDRVALVIGNSNYEGNAILRNPANDADAVEAALKPLGFTVIKKKDLDLAGMEDAIVSFRRTLTKGGVGLFFYAGHGMQVKGENFLVPVGARMREEFEVKRQCLQLESILEAMVESESSLKIVVLDCCRDDPFKRSWSRSSSGGGLAALSNVPEGTVIAFATSPDKTAADGIGKNSPYTENFVKVLQTRPEEGLELTAAFRAASRAVKAQTGQIPWLNMEASLDEFYLWGGGGPVFAKVAPPVPTVPMKVTPNFPQSLALVPVQPAFPKNSTPMTSPKAIRLGLWHGDSAEQHGQFMQTTPTDESGVAKGFYVDFPDANMDYSLRRFGEEMERQNAGIFAETKMRPGRAISGFLIPEDMDVKHQMDPKDMLKLTEIKAVVLLEFSDAATLATALLQCVESGRDCIVITHDVSVVPRVVKKLRDEGKLFRLFASQKIVWIKPENSEHTHKDRIAEIGTSGFEDFFDAIRLRYMVTSHSILRYIRKVERPSSTPTLRVYETQGLVPSASLEKKVTVDPSSPFK